MTTLKYLFPVGYPVINNINDSYGILNGETDMNTLLFNPFKDYTSYIKLDGSPYTIQGVTWINDGYNFNKTVDDYKITSRITKATNDTDYYVYKETVSENVNIIVALDLIKGELNAKEKKNIACPYTGEVLGTKLHNFLHSQDYDKLDVKQDRLLFDIASKKGIQGTTQIVNTSANNDIDKKYITEIEKWINDDTTRDLKADKKKAYENLSGIFNKISNNAGFKQVTTKTTGYNAKQTIYDILDKVGNYKSSRGIDLFYYLNLV
jgi:dGTP triphosphohydrolase